MYLHGSTGSNPNVVPKVDERKGLMRRTEASNESSYHTTSALKEIRAQKAEVIEAWTQALEYHDGKDADNVDGDIKIENEESRVDR